MRPSLTIIPYLFSIVKFIAGPTHKAHPNLWLTPVTTAIAAKGSG